MTGLVALALTLSALLSAALAPAASAGPTALCAAAENPCSAVHRYPAGTTVAASLQTGTKFDIQVGGWEHFKCSEASLGIETRSGVDEPLPAGVVSFPLGGCEVTGVGLIKNCSVTTFLPASETSLEGSKWAKGNGVINDLAVTWIWKCLASGIWWEFSIGGAVDVELHGGNVESPEVLLNFAGAKGLSCSGGICLEEQAEIAQGAFELDSPNPVYVEDSSGTPVTALCKSSTYGPFCRSADRYGAGTQLSAGLVPKTALVIKGQNPTYTIKCDESTLKAETSASTGSPLGLGVSGRTFGSCYTLPTKKSCTVKSLELGSMSVTWAGGSLGTLGFPKKPVTYVDCNIPLIGHVTCELVPGEPEAALEGGSPAHISISDQDFEDVGTPEHLCADTNSLEVQYEVTSPKPLYVTGWNE